MRLRELVVQQLSVRADVGRRACLACREEELVLSLDRALLLLHVEVLLHEVVPYAQLLEVLLYGFQVAANFRQRASGRRVVKIDLKVDPRWSVDAAHGLSLGRALSLRGFLHVLEVAVVLVIVDLVGLEPLLVFLAREVLAGIAGLGLLLGLFVLGAERQEAADSVEAHALR